MTNEEQAKAIVQRIVSIYPSTVGIIGPDYEPGQRLVAAITAALQATEQAVWRQVKDYQQMRICLADQGRCVEVLAGNIVKEAIENGAIAELRGLETWINEQVQP